MIKYFKDIWVLNILKPFLTSNFDLAERETQLEESISQSINTYLIPVVLLHFLQKNYLYDEQAMKSAPRIR